MNSVTDNTYVQAETRFSRNDYQQYYQQMALSQKEGKICGNCGKVLGDSEHVTLCSWGGFTHRGRALICDACMSSSEINHATEFRRPAGAWYSERYIPGIEMECFVCNRPICVTPHRAQRDRCCSDRCYALREKVRQRRHKQKQSTCGTCLEQFSPTRTDSKYCSPACRQKSYRRRTTAQTPAPAA